MCGLGPGTLLLYPCFCSTFLIRHKPFFTLSTLIEGAALGTLVKVLAASRSGTILLFALPRWRLGRHLDNGVAIVRPCVYFFLLPRLTKNRLLVLHHFGFSTYTLLSFPFLAAVLLHPGGSEPRTRVLYGAAIAAAIFQDGARRHCSPLFAL